MDIKKERINTANKENNIPPPNIKIVNHNQEFFKYVLIIIRHHIKRKELIVKR